MLVNISPAWRAAGPVLASADRATSPRLVGGSAPSACAELILVRPARISDMRAVEPLIRAFANDNLMLPKSFDQLARNFREFVVALDEHERIVGCGALRIYTEDLAEICSLAVDEPFQRAGIGRMVVERLLEEARRLEIGKVFALTLRPDFFRRIGFHTTPREDFPLKVWADCRSCPKLHACDEIAVAMKLAGAPAHLSSSASIEY